MSARTVALMLVIAVCGVARADDSGCGSPDEFARLQSDVLKERGPVLALQLNRACFGDVYSDNDGFVAEFYRALTADAPPGSPGSAAARAAALLEEVAILRSTGSEVEAHLWVPIARELRSLVQTLESNSLSGDAVPTFWDLPQNTDTAPIGNREVDVYGRITCPQPALITCSSYENRRDILRVFRLVERIDKWLGSGALASHLAAAKRQTREWDLYFTQALPQFPWEVGLNGWLMRERRVLGIRLGEDLCQRDESGIQRGFCRIPEWQVIALHPSVALQFSRGATDVEELRPAVALDIIGRNTWTFNKGSLARRFGWSLVTVYSNGDSEDRRWTYGGKLYFGSMNVAVTTGGRGQVALTISSNAAAKYFEKREEFERYLRAFDKPSLSTLF